MDPQLILVGKAGVGAGTLTGHHAAQLQVRPQSTGGAHADDVLHAVLGVQLMGVDADGGHSHAGGHHGDGHALIGAGVALDAPDVVHQHGVFQEGFGDELGAQGVAGHQNGFGEGTGCGAVMGGRHG